MAKKTSAEDIEKRMDQAVDWDFYIGQYRQMCMAFGEPWRRQAAGENTPGDFPDFPEITVRMQKIARTRRIINAQFQHLATIMYSDPIPTIGMTDKWTAEILKQFYTERATAGGGYEGEWSEELAAWFIDGDSLGTSWCEIQMVTNPETGYQKTSIQHIPAIQMIWDKHERNPARARWQCPVKYLPVDEAEVRFGMKAIKNHIKRYHDTDRSKGVESVRIFEYWDLGHGKGYPTQSVHIGSFKEPPVMLEESAFPCLPAVPYVHFLVPGMQRPIGRVLLQLATEATLNKIEKYMNDLLDLGPGVDLIDVTQLDEADTKRWNSGLLTRIKVTNPNPNGSPPITRVPAAEAPDVLFQLQQVFERQFNWDSGTTEFDRGTHSGPVRTLGENQLLDQRSQTGNLWSKRQALLAFRRLCQTFFKIAGLFDRDPIVVDLFGNNVLINNAEDPRSTINNFTDDQYKIVIGEDSMETRDVEEDRQRRLLMLREIIAEVQAGFINPLWYVEEKLKAIGEGDPREAMRGAPIVQAMMQGQAQQEGQEGQQQEEPVAQ